MIRRLCKWVYLAFLFGCGTPADAPLDAGVNEEQGQGTLALAPLVINEISPKPSAGEDWLELYNRSNAAVDLCDYFVTDSVDRLEHYYHLGKSPPPSSCDPRWLEAGEYLLVWADDGGEGEGDHAPFKLGTAEAAYVVSVRGSTVDSLIYLLPNEKAVSLARIPNGEGLFWPVTPTPGTVNLGEEGQP